MDEATNAGRGKLEPRIAETDPTLAMETVTAPAKPRRSLSAGEVLGGRFRIERFLGAGGMGEVYEVEDLELGGRLALKTLRAHLLDEPLLLNRFRDEVKLARQVTHPNVCRIFDVGHDGDRVFLTMELLVGETLRAYMKRCGKLSREDAMPLVRQMAAGLGALHERGIAHRDFKPGNVLIVSSPGAAPRAVVTDLGLARLPEDTATMTGQAMGTPDYMAPEQLMGEPAGAAADLYALGLVMYEMVSGRKAYPGGGATENAMQRMAGLPEAPGAGGEWDAVILRCLERDREKRPASAAALVAALEGGGLPQVPAAASPAGRSRWKRPVLAAAAVVAGVAGLWLAAGGARRAEVAGPSNGAHATYLKAKAELDHYYRPHGTENAIRLFQETLRQDRNFAMAYVGLAQANFIEFVHLNDPNYIPAVRSNADQALKLDETLAPAHVTMGRLYTETGDYGAAKQELNMAVKLDRNNAEAHFALAKLAWKQGRTGEVEPEFRTAMSLAPEDWRFPDGLADFLEEQGKLNEAVALHEATVKISPDNPRALNNLGMAYKAQGRLEDARQQYLKAIAIEPGVNRYLNLGVALEEQGKRAESAAAYSSAIELSPKNYKAWGNLGGALYGVAGREEESREAFRKAIELGEGFRKESPKDATLLSILGRDYAFAGMKDLSLARLRQAEALAPENAEVLYRYGHACELLHMRADALRLLARAMERGISLPVIESEVTLAELRKDPGFKQMVTQYARKP